MIIQLRRTASSLLAAAIVEMFPGVQLLGGRETLSGFFYDFDFPHPIHPDFPHQVEDRMHRIAKEKRKIRIFDMAPSSAKELLKSRGQFQRADEVDEETLLSMVEMGSFVDISCGDLLSETTPITHFKIFEPLVLSKKRLRIQGAIHPSKEELKAFLKQRVSYIAKRHEKVGEMKGLWQWTSGGALFLPPGLKAMEELLAKYKETLCASAKEVRTPPGADLYSAWKNLQCESVFEVRSLPIVGEAEEAAGLLLPKEGTVLRMLAPLQTLISRLQSTQKTFTILGFNSRVRLIGSVRQKTNEEAFRKALQELGWSFEVGEEKEDVPRLDFLVQDGLGREWSALSIQAGKCLDVQVLVERNLALLLEVYTKVI